MRTAENVLDWIYECIDETNLLLSEDKQIKKAPDTSLFGEESTLDSLTFINLIIAVEERTTNETGAELVLMGSEDFFQDMERLSSVVNLANFIFQQIKT